MFLKTVDIYLEMPSNSSYNGFVVEVIFEVGYTRKSRCFEIRTLTLLSTLIDKFLQKLKLEPYESM